jgi:hypothetical protein
MPIAMGINCEKCGIVYLITTATNDFIEYVPRAGFDVFALRCRRCGTTRSFHKNDLKPYSVSTHDYARGYAERGEYSVRQDLVHVPSRKPTSQRR